jgi:hypothetical protein
MMACCLTLPIQASKISARFCRKDHEWNRKREDKFANWDKLGGAKVFRAQDRERMLRRKQDGGKQRVETPIL